METDLILLVVGVKPNLDLVLKMCVRIGRTGAIVVNDRQPTSLENVYSTGDCCESYHSISKQWVNIPLGDVTNKQGRLAVRNIGGKMLVFPGIVGTQSFRLFNLEAGTVKSGYNQASILVWENDVAPPMSMKKIGFKRIAYKTSGKY